MTPEQLKEIKKTIVGAAQILDEKLDAIIFRLDDLERAAHDLGSQTMEVSDQSDTILDQLEEIRAWCAAIQKSNKKGD